MRISDWSSDVCSSDLRAVQLQGLEQRHCARLRGQALELRGRQEVSGGIPDPRRAAGQLRQRLELPLEPADLRRAGLRGGDDRLPRSEEHTSELQSLMRISYAVFCLKKKKTTIMNEYHKSSMSKI